GLDRVPGMTNRNAIVVGGGLAGLTAATLLARAGRRVTLYERSPAVGGRAITQDEKGFRLNLGPHALYRGGAGARILKRLGIEVRGGMPKPSGGHAVANGVAHTLPAGPVSLITTGLLGLSAKLEVARLLNAIGKIESARFDAVPVSDWLASDIRHDGVRALVAALFRLATYTNDPERQSAGAAIRQLQLALAANVTYLDGGWQTLVDQLRGAAEAAGVRLVAGRRVTGVEHDGAVRGIRLEDGSSVEAERVVLTLAPDEVAPLLAGEARAAAERWASAAIPVRAACLDVGLSKLPRPKSTFALGIDRLLYLSVHSAVARLAPGEQALIQVAKYLPPGTESDPRAVERELEGLLDTIQPGWREVLVVRRFLPRLTVMNAFPTAAAGGTAGRPAAAVPGVRGLFIAGDWVGPEGQLADASFASASRAAELAAAGSPVAVAA
ncbi:MAG TPA: FAD-dependent oxidoreductase, partial [Candidatus Binatia bacterium]|nr:FAD-dependent oxidoreductase [Candidatus Binatia bacterium]